MKKIGEIKGVPVVEGAANLVKNQILYKETDKGISLSKRTNGKLEEVSGGGSEAGDGNYYYRINKGQTINFAAEFVLMLTSFGCAGGINLGPAYVSAGSEGSPVTWCYVFKITSNNLDGVIVSENSFTFTLTDVYSGQITHINIPEGDIIDKAKALFQGAQMEVSEAEIEELNNLFVPITKEEYYSMVTN